MFSKCIGIDHQDEMQMTVEVLEGDNILTAYYEQID